MPVNKANTATHNFTVKTSGNLPVTPRGVIAGFIHPDGIRRLIAGSSQNPGANQGSWMMVFKHDTGSGFWDFTQEVQFRFTTGQWDMFEPILCHDFDGDGVDEIFAKLNNEPCFVKWNGSAYALTWTDEAALITCYWGATIADVDRDGLPELVIGSETSTYVYSWDAGFSGFVQDAALAGATATTSASATSTAMGFRSSPST